MSLKELLRLWIEEVEREMKGDAHARNEIRNK